MSDKLKEIVIKMLQENTGAHMLDSGGAYGRHWEANQKISSEIRVWDKMPIINSQELRYGELLGSISLYHHLVNSLEWDGEVEYVNRLFKKWDELHPEWDSWEKLMESFYDAITGRNENSQKQIFDGFYGDKYSEYTYNVENDLNQNFFFIVMGKWVFIQIHGGCDARSGFTRPRLFKFNDNLLNYLDYTIYCKNPPKGENHYWDKQGYNYWYTETDFDMKTADICKYDDLSDEEKSEFDSTGFAMGNPEIKYAEDGQKILQNFNVRLRKPASSPKLIIKNSVAYCPICGSELGFDKIYLGR